MKKAMILLAGYPATGKTFLCSRILKRHSEFIVVSQDEMKEKLWDRFGFENIEEKTRLEDQSWELYYETLEELMSGEHSVISDYPFSEKQKGRLESLSLTYGYQVLTIRLTGDIDVLYERSKSRDLEPSRHLAHLVTRYHEGDVLEDRTKADALVTYEIFKDRCLNKGYDRFQLGSLIELDVTDYERVDYEAVLDRVDEIIDRD